MDHSQNGLAQANRQPRVTKFPTLYPRPPISAAHKRAISEGQKRRWALQKAKKNAPRFNPWVEFLDPLMPDALACPHCRNAQNLTPMTLLGTWLSPAGGIAARFRCEACLQDSDLTLAMQTRGASLAWAPADKGTAPTI